MTRAGKRRFVRVESNSLSGGNILSTESASVILDTETGVNYLLVQTGYAGGLTVLVDKDGKPIIDKTINKEGSSQYSDSVEMENPRD